jgi:hypothetical protein
MRYYDNDNVAVVYERYFKNHYSVINLDMNISLQNLSGTWRTCFTSREMPIGPRM